MISTTIEQSQHLLELGLDPKTANMYWIHVQSQTRDFWKLEVIQRYWRPYEGVDSHLPAWSLSALLEVMPNKIESDDIQHYFHLEKSMEYNWFFISYYFDDVDELYELKTTKQYENPIAAAYEMICWLLEQGLIEKGDNDE